MKFYEFNLESTFILYLIFLHYGSKKVYILYLF